MSEKKKLKLSERLYEASFWVATLPARPFVNSSGTGNVTDVAFDLIAIVASAVITLPVWLAIAGLAYVVSPFEG